MRLPRLYVVGLGLVGLLFAFVALTAAGVVTVQSIFLLLLNYVFQFFAVTVLAALGGVFLGMVLAHRMFSQRRFTPFEESLLQNLADVRTELQRVQVREQELQDQLRRLEKRLDE
ncbi:MAG: hypothetical protein LC624_09050 [Halobacteriales archaeon]|nr:hypothetical protein [Halobacteriales archaeon]